MCPEYWVHIIKTLFFIKTIKIIQEILTSYFNLSIILKVSFNYILSIK